VKKVLIFLSDGAANSAPVSKLYVTTPNGVPPQWQALLELLMARFPGDWWQHINWGSTTAWSSYVTQPCGQAVSSAATMKASGTTVFTIGYDIQQTLPPPGRQRETNQCFQAPHDDVDYMESLDPSGYTAYTALRAIASSPDRFYDQSTPGPLTNIFTSIAGTLTQAKLIPPPAGS
jgi:hypothetical protein